MRGSRVAPARGPHLEARWCSRPPARLPPAL